MAKNIRPLSEKDKKKQKVFKTAFSSSKQSNRHVESSCGNDAEKTLPEGRNFFRCLQKWLKNADSSEKAIKLKIFLWTLNMHFWN